MERDLLRCGAWTEAQVSLEEKEESGHLSISISSTAIAMDVAFYLFLLFRCLFKCFYKGKRDFQRVFVRHKKK